VVSVNEAYPINMECKEYDEILDKPICSDLLYMGPEIIRG